MSEYVVVLNEPTMADGAHLPDLPGVVALGASRAEVSDRIREAVNTYAEEMMALGHRLPDPVAATQTIQPA